MLELSSYYLVRPKLSDFYNLLHTFVILHNIFSLQMALHGASEVHGNVEMRQCIM